MSDLNWRIWAYDKLRQSPAFTALIPANHIYGAGGIDSPRREKKYCVIKLGTEVPGPFPGVSRQRFTLWLHDEPGDYLAIGAALRAAKAALVGADATVGQVVAIGGVACSWQGDSEDLADQELGTIFRTSTFDCQGRNGNA